MEYATKLTPSNVAVTWTQHDDWIEHVVYEVSTRTIVVVWGDKLVRCRIGSYDRDTAVALWKALVDAKESGDRVYLCAKGTWSPNEWFCGIYNSSAEDRAEDKVWEEAIKEVLLLQRKTSSTVH